MTEKEKAKDLVKKMLLDHDMPYYLAKECALIAVDEIIDLLPNINLIPPIQRKPDEFYFQYWHIVKQEIEKL
jgi:hypothetical protein